MALSKYSNLEKSMKVISSAAELEKEVQSVLPPKRFSLNYKDSVVYDCGCGEAHAVNSATLRPSMFGTSITVLGTGFPVKFLFQCSRGYMTFVKMKGVFNPRAETIWTYEVTNEEIQFGGNNQTKVVYRD